MSHWGDWLCIFPLNLQCDTDIYSAQEKKKTSILHWHDSRDFFLTICKRKKILFQFSIFNCIPFWMKRWQHIWTRSARKSLNWWLFWEVNPGTRGEISLIVSCCSASSGNTQTTACACAALGFFKRDAHNHNDVFNGPRIAWSVHVYVWRHIFSAVTCLMLHVYNVSHYKTYCTLGYFVRRAFHLSFIIHFHEIWLNVLNNLNARFYLINLA